jgi:hypothetical protein
MSVWISQQHCFNVLAEVWLPACRAHLVDERLDLAEFVTSDAARSQ